MLGLRQCALFPFPACWGCRIVHRSLAISMALAAVPGACDGLQRCTDLSSVQRRARRCAGRECSRGARSTREACAEHEKNLLFSAARSARAEAARRSRARRREVRALLCTLAACGLEGPWVHGFERVAMAAARKEPKHSAEYILSTGVVFSQYLTILSHVCRVNTLLCRRIGRGTEGTSCCEVFSLENHPL